MMCNTGVLTCALLHQNDDRSTASVVPVPFRIPHSPLNDKIDPIKNFHFGGWYSFFPPEAATLYFKQPTLISRLRVLGVNIAHSVHKVNIYYDASPDSSDKGAEPDWVFFAKLRGPNKNRMRLMDPPNEDSFIGTTCFDFYVFGDDSCDPFASPDPLPVSRRTRSWPAEYEDDENDDDEDEGRYVIEERIRGSKLSPATFTYVASHKWKIAVIDEGDWVGINNLDYYGLYNAAPAPSSVQASKVPDIEESAESAVDVSWQYESKKISELGVTGFAVYVHHGGPTTAPQLMFQLEGAAAHPISTLDTHSCYTARITGLDTNIVCAFSVAALNSSGDHGTPSRTTGVVVGDTGYSLIDDDESVPEGIILDAKNESNAKKLAPPPKQQVQDQPVVTNTTFFDADEMEPIYSEATVIEKRRILSERESLRTRLQGRDPLNLTLSWEEIELQREDDIEATMRGLAGFEAVARVQDYNSANVFLSSTFVDTQVERNYLTEQAVPILQELCRGLGLSFEMTDFRWGISDQMTMQHLTEDICLSAVQKCLSTSIATSFVFFSSQRYGWRNLPRTIEASKLDEILAFIPDGQAKDTIHTWYLLDSNALPPRYDLRNLHEPNPSNQPFFDDPAHGIVGAQAVMQNAIYDVLRAREEIDRFAWFPSITEREVTRGILERQGGATMELQCLAIRRTIEGAEKEKHPGYFSSGEDEAMIARLMERTKQALPEGCFVEYNVPWVGEAGISVETHGEYLRTMCEFFVEQVGERVKLAAKHRRLLKAIEKEVAHHVRIALEKSGSCFGRDELKAKCIEMAVPQEELDSMAGGKREGEQGGNESSEAKVQEAKAQESTEETTKANIVPGKRRYTVVFGGSGSGKTSIMCHSAVTVSKNLTSRLQELAGTDSHPIVCIRLCGTSADSSSAASLITSISQQIRIAISNEELVLTGKETFGDTVKIFHATLALATESKPFYLFLDSLDQLNDQDSGRSKPWRWLPGPSVLPPHVHIVLSVLPDSGRYQYGILDQLSHYLDPSRFVKVPLMAPEESTDILTAALEASGRRLTSDQLDLLRTALPKGEATSALHIRLLLDRVLEWKSHMTVEDLKRLGGQEGSEDVLPGSVTELIRGTYAKIEKLHNGPFVRQVMRLLLCSKDGLSERNLADIISTQDEILGTKGRDECLFEYNDPPIRYIPPMVFANWRKLIGGYIVERGQNGANVLALYHRQFIEVAESMYLRDPQDRINSLNLIYNYFSGNLADQYSERNISPQPLFLKKTATSTDDNKADAKAVSRLSNTQRLREAVAALIGLKDLTRSVKEICSIEYVQSKVAAGSSFASDLLSELMEVQAMIDQQLKEVSAGDEQERLQAMRKLVVEYYIFAFNSFQAMVADPNVALGLAKSYPTGSSLREEAEKILSVAEEGRMTLQLMNSAESNASYGTISFTAPTEAASAARHRLMDVSAPPDSIIFVVTQRAQFTVFNRATLREVFSKAPGSAKPEELFWTTAAVSLSGNFIASADSNGTLYIWSAESGELVASKVGAHASWIMCMTWSGGLTTEGAVADPNDLRLATGGSDHVVRVWKVSTVAKESDLQEGTSVKSQLVRFELLGTLYGHTARITSVIFSPDGQRLASSSRDGRVVVWDTFKSFEALQLFSVGEALGSANCVQWCGALDGSGIGEEVVGAYDRQSIVFWPIAEEMKRAEDRTSARSVLQGVGFSEISACSISPSGKEVLVVGADSRGRIFDRVSGQLVAGLQDHAEWITKCDWDTDFMLTISNDSSLKIWNRERLSALRVGKSGVPTVDEPAANIEAIVWHTDPSAAEDAPLIMQIRDGNHNERWIEIRRNNQENYELVETSSEEVSNAGGSPSLDGKLWVKGEYGRGFSVIEDDDAEKIMAHEGFNSSWVVWPSQSTNDVAKSRCAVGGHCKVGSVILVDAKQRRVVSALPIDQWTECVSFFAETNRIVCVGQRKATVWDVTSDMTDVNFAQSLEDAKSSGRKPLREIDQRGKQCDVSADGRRCVIIGLAGSVGYKARIDGCVVYDLTTGERVCELPPPDEAIGQTNEQKANERQSPVKCKITSDGKYAMIVYSAGHPLGRPSVAIYDLDNGGRRVATFVSPSRTEFTVVSVHPPLEKGGKSKLPVIVLGDKNGALYVLECR
ncbi:hypothetical protein BJ742DRAFT_816614 [Cladochytrium replicatum]|nr:hypothetical protein BJ742DRAFT_816614 [Cladochytrium replicatum]